MNVVLTSNVLDVIHLNKKTSAKLFDKLVIGDSIKLSILVEAVGSMRGKTYAPMIKVENVSTGEYVMKSFNQIESILSCFEFQQGE